MDERGSQSYHEIKDMSRRYIRIGALQTKPSSSSSSSYSYSYSPPHLQIFFYPLDGAVKCGERACGRADGRDGEPSCAPVLTGPGRRFQVLLAARLLGGEE